MPLKKLMYILLSVWLINALVCFQGSNVFDDGIQQTVSNPVPRHLPNTLVRLIRNAGREVDGDEDSRVEKIRYNLSYLNRLQQVAVVYWASIPQSGKRDYIAANDLKGLNGLNNKLAWRLSPDVFIFRLTPF